MNDENRPVIVWFREDLRLADDPAFYAAVEKRQYNRGRMVAPSFLVKHLLIDWREGKRWFWDTLADVDAANNAASWQWIAGSGGCRALLPHLQSCLAGEKFDPDGAYVGRRRNLSASDRRARSRAQTRAYGV